MMKKLIILLCLLYLPSLTYADWLADLESEFPNAVILEFSNYDDWGADITGSGSKQTTGLPTVTSGTNQIDGYVSSVDCDYNAIDDFDISWISKSIRTSFDSTGYGPSSLISWYAEGANLGEVDQYVFFMFHVPKTSFPYNTSWSGTYPDASGTDGKPWYKFTAWKIFDVAMGFESPIAHGNSTLRSYIPSDGMKETYGANFAIVNIFGYSPYNSRRFMASWSAPAADCTSYTFSHESGLKNSTKTNCSWDAGAGAVVFNFDIGQYIWAGEWFGVEWRFNRGTVDTADARIDLWIYDSDGTEVFHGYAIDFVGLTSCEAGGVTYYDDEFNKFNKFVTGSNRLNGVPGYTTCAGTPCVDQTEGSKEFKEASVTTDTFYMDDIIFNDARTGLTYFELLNGESAPSSTASGTANRR